MLSVIYADSEAHPMIYFALAIVFVVWILYRSWKLSEEMKRDRELYSILSSLEKALTINRGSGMDNKKENNDNDV